MRASEQFRLSDILHTIGHGDPNETRNCERCKGEKLVPDLLNDNNKVECRYCKGTGIFKGLDVWSVIQKITTTRACIPNHAKLLTAFPAKLQSARYSNKDIARMYYVWRLARFHGGIDMTLPMTAEMLVSHDPFKEELDSLADEVAKLAFKTDKAAAIRWGRALGY